MIQWLQEMGIKHKKPRICCVSGPYVRRLQRQRKYSSTQERCLLILKDAVNTEANLFVYKWKAKFP